MSVTRTDGWTEQEDRVILENAIEAIKSGKTLKNSFLISAEQLKYRTYSAVSYRYYKVIKHNHNHVIKKANMERIAKINHKGW